MTNPVRPREIGRPLERLEGAAKVTGTATYADDTAVVHPLYVFPVVSTVARARIRAVHTDAAAGLPGVQAVLTPDNAPRLAGADSGEFAVLQSDEVEFAGQIVAAVVADTLEVARDAASRVRVEYEERTARLAFRADDPELYTPGKVNPAFQSDTDSGDFPTAFAEAPIQVDRTYRTPMEHNNPMEPHSTVAVWDEDLAGLTLYDSTQGVYVVRRVLAPVFGLAPDRLRVVSHHVGGGFGSKGGPHAHNVLAGLAAREFPGRAVKLALTRQQTYGLAGHRTPTIQRVRLGADRAGNMLAVGHDAIVHTSTIKEFAEQVAVGTRMMYAAPNRHTSHRLAALNVPIPYWMRAPGETPGIFALEMAMDELAEACGLDPVELRVRNDPAVDPESGLPWSGRHLVECLRQGADRFGWWGREPAPGSKGPHHRGDWLVGHGVASMVYPRNAIGGSVAEVRAAADGGYSVGIGAADIGTGARTILTQIAADALDVPVERVHLRLGDTDQPHASVAGGSSGTTSWGTAIVAAAEVFRAEHGHAPPPGAQSRAEMPPNPDADRYSMYSFGAQFVEAWVHGVTGEVRVPRMLGVFSVGRVINPRTARSQFLGGMTMGLSMALHEESLVDPRYGHVVNRDLAEYHVATNADVVEQEAVWLEEEDPHSNPMGSRGIGEIGIVGTAAAVANATYNATGIRVRELPLTPDKFVR
ncbi:xanthine dehydrogenase family protein molybdopterin-binding subunit [Spiractinospora alimapuensis]|uniref:xanthine dehydrogenase family protein molybdopterin-binding subunit n=1 Tax=Spiractinospora alimapuensis TaxID=2820884 RepID=UPI001F41BF4A|nr:xanthine dehydrogenase family protein molybdopterin-binding subunit [Spiractinospora alimapuensis]QVQ50191.1 xanthine dehydrogenase family protein molybdopterin-binding subunit [Spiractinospora alimapuensis]